MSSESGAGRGAHKTGRAMGRGAELEFAEFYDATWGRTLACAYAMTGDIGTAEEFAQEAYTRAWTRWSQLTTYDEPAAWVRQVATRLAVSRWRRGKVAQAWLARSRREPVTAPPDETSTALVAALRQLTEAQRQAIVLHHLDDLPIDEVARIERCLHEPDLDRALTALTSDLTTCSSGPGARAAVATARKRRRTRLGAAAAIAAVVVVAFAAPSLTGGTADSPHALPIPAPLSASSLTEATQGWTGVWRDLDKAYHVPWNVLDGASACLVGPSPQDEAPDTMGFRDLIADGRSLGDGRSIAQAWFYDYRTHPTVPDEVVSTLDDRATDCEGILTESTYGDVVLSHVAAGPPAGGSVQEMWVAKIGDRLAVLSIVGPLPQASADTVQAVTRVFLAAAQDESSYVNITEGYDPNRPKNSPAAAPSSYPDISLAQIHEATGEWSNDWSNGPSLDMDQLPCVPDPWPDSSSWGHGSTIGDRGILTFSGTNSPTQEVGSLVKTLESCNSAQWTVNVERTRIRRWGWASYAGGSVFFAAGRDVVASLQVRRLGVPSDKVATGIIALLEEALSKPSPTTEPPTPSS